MQHHHAHIAACLAGKGVALDAAPLIGVALDGLGYGLDGTLWGGEFLLADYRDCQRLGTFKPVAMPGGAQAVREPWRNAYAHLMAEMGWARFAMDYADTPLHRFLHNKPRAALDGMIAQGVTARSPAPADACSIRLPRRPGCAASMRSTRARRRRNLKL